MEIVFNKPLGKFKIEYCRIRVKITQLNELFLEGSVKPFIVGIILGMSDAKDNKAVMIITYNQPQPKSKINARVESSATTKFKQIHKHKPTTTLDWSEVSAIAYSGALTKKR
ncbi:MAG: hypothetical protein WCK11_05685 [Candidatus Falkowbacteria bacterium]